MRRLANRTAAALYNLGSGLAADWHELVIPRRGMQPSIASDSGQVDPRRGTTDIPPLQSASLGLHPVARRLLLINRHRMARRVGVGTQQPRAGVEPTTFRSQVRHSTTRPPRNLNSPVQPSPPDDEDITCIY